MASAEVLDAHTHSARHIEEVKRSSDCGCFFCLAVFKSDEIKDWVNELEGHKTAICPHCQIDAVIGDASGFDIKNPDFLLAMKSHWFADAASGSTDNG